MAQQKLSTALANPIRTGAQGGVAFGLTEFLDAFNIVAMDERQYAAVLLLLTLVIGFIQNKVENGLGKGFLRNPTQAAPFVGESKPSGGA